MPTPDHAFQYALHAQRRWYEAMTTPLPTPEEQKAFDRLRMVKKYAAAIAELEAKVTALEMDYFGKANFNPSQPRVPSGSSDGGQWTDGSGSGGPDGSRYAGTPSNPYPRDRIDSISLEKIAAEAVSLGRFGTVARGVTSAIEGIASFLEGGASSARTVEKPPVTGRNSTEVESTGTNLTGHGTIRVNQRGISKGSVEEAIILAKRNGTISTKIGKYGTPQKIYKGSNGITVIIETSGRNAGKVITTYRH